MKSFIIRNIICILLIFSIFPVFNAEIPDSEDRPSREFFWRDTTISPDGYFLITKSTAETNIIAGMRKVAEKLPKNKIFKCESKAAVLEKAVYEGNETDTFFYTLASGQRAMLTMIDFHGDYSRSYRPEEFNIIKIGESKGTISLVIARDGNEQARWGVGWNLSGAIASLSIEDKSKPVLSKEQVLSAAASIRCTRL